MVFHIHIVEDVFHCATVAIMVFSGLSCNRDLVIDKRGDVSGPVESSIIKLIQR